MKEKTLSEKTFTEDGLRVVAWDNVRQFIKGVLKNQFVKFDFSGSEEYRQGFLDGVKYMKDKIKQKSGFKELE